VRFGQRGARGNTLFVCVSLYLLLLTLLVCLCPPVVQYPSVSEARPAEAAGSAALLRAPSTSSSSVCSSGIAIPRPRRDGSRGCGRKGRVYNLEAGRMLATAKLRPDRVPGRAPRLCVYSNYYDYYYYYSYYYTVL
jgi:hypothetical protein